MKQLSFGDAEYAGKRKQTRREVFLAEMDQVVPWKTLLSLIEPLYPVAGRGRHPYPLPTMLRIHLMQNWFGLSDPAMEEALYEVASMRQFAGLSLTGAIPDETTILNFRHLLEANDLAPEILRRVNAHLTRKGLLLKRGSIVDATIIAAPSSTKNADGERDPEMHQTKKGNQWYFGMKAHIGVDAESGLVHTVMATAANEADVEVADELLHGKEEVVYADAGYTGADKRYARKKLRWEIAQRKGRIKALPDGRLKKQIEAAEHRKASIRAKVEHPFRVLKRQFGYAKVRFKGLAKNTVQILTLFALANLWMVRKKLLAMTGGLRPQFGNGM
ncbi:IS5 family transposase [Burkholderia cenocepacia]|uniref:IS5 family transposase n=1 Tax=Burkholderia cenocepacia TaxID=95486 RepID=UPI0028638B7D|nr:IS5 family transposase [Burkholderia cenocepacia]MDR5647274.1 IS5 family transposase [Burkholderia cenocepacia]